MQPHSNVQSKKGIAFKSCTALRTESSLFAVAFNGVCVREEEKKNERRNVWAQKMLLSSNLDLNLVIVENGNQIRTITICFRPCIECEIPILVWLSKFK